MSHNLFPFLEMVRHSTLSIYKIICIFRMRYLFHSTSSNNMCIRSLANNTDTLTTLCFSILCTTGVSASLTNGDLGWVMQCLEKNLHISGDGGEFSSSGAKMLMSSSLHILPAQYSSSCKQTINQSVVTLTRQ